MATTVRNVMRMAGDLPAEVELVAKLQVGHAEPKYLPKEVSEL